MICLWTFDHTQYYHVSSRKVSTWLEVFSAFHRNNLEMMSDYSCLLFGKLLCHGTPPSLAIWISLFLGYMSFIMFKNVILCIHIHFYTEANPFRASDLSLPQTPLFIISSKWITKYHRWCLSNHNKMAAAKLTALWILLRHCLLYFSLCKFEQLYSRKLQ